MNVPKNPTLEQRINILEYKLQTVKKLAERLYAWAYASRIRRSENDKKMLIKAKEWITVFERAIKRGKAIKSISRRRNNTLKIVLAKNRIKE